MTERLLIIDDEPPIAEVLEPVLASQGYAVTIADSGTDGLAAAKQSDFGVILLDLGLPDIDGKDLIAPLRELGSASILILSARHQEVEKIAALDMGADDYLDKPFSINELLARIRAATRKRDRDYREVKAFAAGDLAVDFATRQVRLMGDEMKLSPKEFDLLEILCRHAGQVVTHRRLLLAGWGDPQADGQYLRSYIAMLRQKLEQDCTQPTLIVTEPGVGYRLQLADPIFISDVRSAGSQA